MKKILFLSNIPAPYQLDLIDEMNKYTEYKAYFLWKKQKNRDWNLDLDNVTIADFRFSIKTYYSFLKYFLEYRPDVIIVSGYILPLSYLAYILCRLYGKKYYLWLEQPFPSIGIKRVLKSLYINMRVRQANGVFAIGKKAVDVYSQYNKTIHFPYTMNLQKYLATTNINTIEVTIKFLYVGQFIDRKGVKELLEAFYLMPQKNIELHLVGSGELIEIVDEYVEKDKRIFLSGFVEPTELHKTYAKCDIFIAPSKHDGWALVISEAMAVGMPIIGTDSTGATFEYIKHQINGYICETTIDSIRAGCEYYINNRDKIKEHGKINKNIIATSLSNVKYAAQYLTEFLKSSL